jgi:hypothetical protein
MTTTHGVGIPCLDLGQTQKCGGAKPINEIHKDLQLNASVILNIHYDHICPTNISFCTHYLLKLLYLEIALVRK